jgi:hypothetical protein
MSRVRPTLVATVAALGGAAAAYLLAGRAQGLHWGATKEEVARAMPGDDLLPDADVLATRAMTIDAPPDAIWP